MKIRTTIAILLVFLLSISTNIYASAAPEPGPIDLGTLGGSWSTGLKINETGMVIGYSSTTNSGEYHAFLWQGGNMMDLGTLGGSNSWTNDINTKGQIVGGSQTADGNQHAFLWESGSLIDLGTLRGSYANAADINDSGDIAGCSTTADGQYHAAYWRNGDLVDVGSLLGGVYSCAYYINNRGQILGDFVTASDEYHGFLYQNDVVTDLGYFEPRALSDTGKALGKTINSNNEEIAVIWDGKQMHELGQIEGAFGINILEINNNGQVIGYYYDEQWSENYFLWDNGLYQFLDFTAIGINNSGTILGKTNNYEGILWSEQSASYFHGIQGGTIYPSYITNNDLVTGQCLMPDDYPHACVWLNE